MALIAISTRKFVRIIPVAIISGYYKTVADGGRLLIHPDEEPLYTCPNKNCNPKFKTLVDLIQHLESGTCGAMQRAKVARIVRFIFTDTGPIRA